MYVYVYVYMYIVFIGIYIYIYHICMYIIFQMGLHGEIDKVAHLKQVDNSKLCQQTC